MKKGIIALPTIILIGGIILDIALTLSLVSYLMFQSGPGSKFAAEAWVAAQAGIEDSIMKIIRSNNFGSGAGYKYVLTLDSSRQANVFACKDFRISDNFQELEDICDESQPNTGKIEVISLGKAFNKNRLIRAFVNIDANNGEIRILSVEEIAI